MDNIIVSTFLWQMLFEENQIASKLISISTEPDGVIFNVGQFGEVTFKCYPASKPGDNFMSETFIGTATISDGTSFRTFIKILPTNTMMRDFAYGSGAHQREISMYSIFFDLLRQIPQEKGLIDEDLSLDVPNIYYVHLEESTSDKTDGSGTCILMEDIVQNGFRMVDKHAGCDDDHVRLSLNSLAKYHALTIASLNEWKDQDGKIVYPPEAEFLKESTLFDRIATFFEGTCDNFVKRFKTLERQDLTDWLTSIPETEIKRMFAPGTIENSGPLACVLHGDYWGNNMLFKYEDTDNPTKPTAVKMVDFQIARIGHPVTDLLYYFYTSTLPEVRKEHLTSWLSFYFNTLMMYLKKLEVEIANYTLDDFMADYKERSIAMAITSGNVLITVLDKESVSHLDKIGKFIDENVDSDEEGERGVLGYSRRFEEKVKKYMDSQPPYTGNPVVNLRFEKLIDEVLELNGVSLN